MEGADDAEDELQLPRLLARLEGISVLVDKVDILVLGLGTGDSVFVSLHTFMFTADEVALSVGCMETLAGGTECGDAPLMLPEGACGSARLN